MKLSYLMYIYSGAECVGKLVRVQLHVGLEHVSWVGNKRCSDPGYYTATEVDGTGCGRRLHPFCKDRHITVNYLKYEYKYFFNKVLRFLLNRHISN